MKKVKPRKVPVRLTRREPAANTAPLPKGQKIAKKARGAMTGKRSTPRGQGRSQGKPAAKARGRIAPALNIRELDPLRICGGSTSVLKLFRVDEQPPGGKAAGARQVHLVFNDRHGWYCEHGRSCHAVSAVMRHARIR